MKAKAAPLAFTRLEQAVLDALSWELSSIAPDLTGQLRESRPTARLDSGSGFLTEVLVSTDRPWPQQTTNGDFGTVHCLIDGLRDAVAFQARLRGGRLVALVADAYGQDTRRIDWSTVRFEQVFTLGARGESILFDPGPSWTAQRHTAQPRRAGETRPQPRREPKPQQQNRPSPVSSTAAQPSARTSTTVPADIPIDEPNKEQLTSNAIGVWVACIAGAFILAWVTGLPMIFSVIAGFMLARQLTKPDQLRAIARATSKAGDYRVSADGKTLSEMLERRE